MKSRPRTHARALVALLIGTTVAACGGGAGSSAVPRSGVPASQSPGPALVVERFLTAANANDLETMTDLFGTTDRTIVELEGRTRAERRMYVLASVLRHEDWSILGQETVPGRIHDATELQVRITQQENRTAVVPFLVVRRSDGGWIIERIDIQLLTTTRGG